MSEKILLIRNTHPDNFGGAEIYQIVLAKELKKQGLSPIIVSSSVKTLENSASENIENIKAPYFKLQNWSGWRNLLLPAFIIWQVYLYFWYKKLFKKYSPDCINIQSRDDWIAATLAAKYTKMPIKILWTDHIDFRIWVLENVNVKYKNFIGKFILKVAKIPNKIIFISDFEYRYFQEVTKRHHLKNTIVIKNGAIDQRQNFTKTKVIPQQICYVGRLEDYKGIMELISAYQELAPEFPDSTLEIYGSGSLANFVQQYESPQIHYHGFTNDPLSKIAQSEIFVLPSYREGLSLSLIDATMLGKAIIATDIDGNPEVVEDELTGLLIPAQDPKKLAQALKKLLKSSSLTKKFGQKARQKYEREFNFSIIVKTSIIPLMIKSTDLPDLRAHQDATYNNIIPNNIKNVKDKLVSIIIPIFNTAEYLENCLNSVKNQTHQNLEIIMVNDGSTDNSLEICKRFCQEDQRFRLINQKNQGLSEARNQGIAKATGDYIFLLDGDDALKSHIIFTLLQNSENSDLVVCGYDTVYLDSFRTETTSPLPQRISGTQATTQLLTQQKDYQVMAWNKLYKRELFKDIKYPKGQIHEDNLTTYKLISKANQVTIIPDSLYLYYKRKNSITDQSRTITRLDIKHQAALEAQYFFKNYSSIKPAADIAVLLSQFGYLDHIIKGQVENSNHLFEKTVNQLQKTRPKYLKNPYLTRKLRFYLFIVHSPKGFFYKIFRKIF